MTRLELAARLLEAMMPAICEEFTGARVNWSELNKRLANDDQFTKDGDAPARPNTLFHANLAWRLAGDLIRLAVHADGREAKPEPEPQCDSGAHGHCSRCGSCDGGSCICYAR